MKNNTKKDTICIETITVLTITAQCESTGRSGKENRPRYDEDE